MKKFSKRHLFLILTAVLVAALVPVCSFILNASAAQITSGSGTWISGKLTYTYSVDSNGTSDNGAAGTVSASGSELTITATNSKEASGCTTTAAEATTTTVTVTNASSYPLKINSLNTNQGSPTITGVAAGDVISPGATFSISVNAPAVASSTKVTAKITITVEEQTSVTITLAPSPYVGYTVNNHTVAQNGSEQTFTTDAGTSIALPTITAPSGYEFKGWRIGSSMVTGNSFTANGALTVFPVIVTEGVDITAANFKVNNATYTFWEDAVNAAIAANKPIFVNLEEVTLPDNVLDNLLPASGGTYVKPASGGVEYILPGGVTLVLPYSTSTTVHTTAPAYEYKQRVNPYPFRTLYMPSGVKMTVNGSISVDSNVSAYGQSNQGNGTPSGPHGKIVVRTGAEMTLNSGANLYCWGYINGDGHIYLKSGAKVYELFQFCDWRGGNGTNNINGNSQRVFPMSQYYVQNVEAPMTLYKGATEYCWSVVNMSSSGYPCSPFEFIGTNGMFKLTGSSSDYITKRYHANVDQLEIAAHGNMEMNKLSVKVSGLPLIGSITMNSNEYVLPLNNMNVVVETGTTSISSSQTYGVAFLPSSKLTVNEGATFAANAPVYFYDADDWGGYCGASNLKLVVSGYSTANGTTTMRTADNLEDAEMNVNGTVNVTNKLYTTEHGAHITSSEGTGVINFTTACATGSATTYQATQSGTSISYVEIPINNAWLQNGDGSYQYTVGTGTSTWYYDKDGENWYRYKVDMLFNGNFVARGYYCELNDTLTYDADWLTNLGASVTSGSATVAVSGTNVVITDVTANSEVTLTGVPAEYAPTFVLNEAEYAHYQMYTGNTISNTTTIGDDTYYIVDQGSVMAVGTAYAAPTDAAMGESAENHNEFLWNLSGVSFTSGDPYRGTVPVGETAGGPAYIYGFYDGAVAYNSYTDAYYRTLKDAFIVLPQDVTATITLLADCGTFEEESGTTCYATYDANNVTLDLNGHHAVGRIAANGTFTLELNGGTLDFETGATAPAAAYKGLSAIVNNGTMVIRDSVGGGVISCDAMSTASGVDGSAVIRNNAGATLTITGKDSEHKLRIYQKQAEATYSSSYGYYAYNYGIYNPGRITALTYVDVSSAKSRSCSVNIYNYNDGVIDLISDCHMFSGGSSSVFNYGGTITMIDNLTADGKTGITNRNLVTGTAAAGKTVTDANKGVITTIQNCHIEVGSYAISNHAVINTVKNCTLIAHPDSAQVDIYGDGLSRAVDGNTYCYTVYNSQNWYYDTNIWKQTDSSSGGYTRVNYYREEEQYRPTIGTIENCEIRAEITSTSASHGYALVNYGVINKIGGTTNIEVKKHQDNAKISVAHYGLHNLGGGIIKSIEGTVNVSATGIGAVYNDGAFTTQINYTYSNKVGGILTHQKNTYGQPSTINSITCAGTWSCGGSSSYYYALYNTGYIQTINSTGLTLTGGCNVLYNATAGAHKTYEITKSYTDAATASTEYMRVQTYVKNLEKGSTIGTINGITVTGYGAKSYYVVNNQGHIGTVSNVTVNFASGATANSSYYAAFLNGDSRYAEYTETIRTNRTTETDPLLTVSAGVVTRYDRDYTYATPTIDTIDNLTVTSMTAYAFRNAGAIGTLKNSTITGTQYALHNYASGPYTERQTLQYYSGTSIFATTKYTSEYSKHYERGVATINLIDNCTITTPANTYAMFNSGHVGTIKNSTLQAGTTTAKAYALWNGGASTIVGTEREYTCNLADYFYVTANGGTSCTAYWGSGGETKVVTYDYDVPTIDLIGEGNTFRATSAVIANTGIITAINSGEGTLTTITGSSQKSSAIYNYSACLDARTATTEYTAPATLPASGTGTAVNDDTLLSGAQIGTIKNVQITTNGYGILNGDAAAGKLPTIGEIGEGTEINANCTSGGYHAIYNQANAKITSITGGVYTVKTATTPAYKNNYANAETATLISGGDFKGMANTRDNAIYLPDNTDRQTYPAGYTLSSTTETVTLHDGTTTVPCYFIAKLVTVSFNANEGTGTMEAQSDEQGKTLTLTANAFERSGYTFTGWNTEADGSGTPYADEASVTLSDDLTLYAQWVQDEVFYTVTWKNGDTVLKTDEDVAGGTVPSYSGETPTKAADATYHYTFSGWDPTPAALSDDAVYTAQFTQTAHTWNDGTVTTAATCTTDGVKTLTCTVCGQTKTEAISALGHDMVTDAAVAATCTETGLTEGSHCSRCDYAVAQTVVPALGHDIVTDAAVAATCTETGLTAGEHCTRCDYAVAQETVPALGHDMVTDAAVAATCTETGLTEGSHCSRCDYAVAQETVPALGHDMITDAAVAATCTETGLTEGSHCSRCDYAVAQEVVPALGHDMITDAAVAATCTETGLTEGSHCSRCDYAVAQETVPALGHDMITDAAVAATCTETGLTEGSHCSRCDYAVAQEVVPALGHDMITDAAVAATCTETGLTEGSHCSRCDYAVAQTVVPALGHDIVTDAAVAATCTETGLTAGEHCTRCDYAVAQETVPALGHNIVTDEAVAATCTATGLTAGEHCTRCDYAVAQETVPALGHDMITDAAVAATCTETGLTEGSHCSRCDYAVAQETVPALGHDMITDAAVAATCTETGLTEGSHCSRCDYAVAQTVVPALGHDIVTDAAVAATCTETGLTAGEHCSRCDYAVAQETVPALGHDIVTDAAVAATCTETGLTAGEHCSRCDYAVAQQTVPALGHDMITDAAVAATCTETGLTEGSHCSRCDYAVAQTVVPALGHDLVTDAAVAATCTEPGLTAGEHCTRCDYAVAQTEVPALGHDIVADAAVAATCTEPGLTAGEHCTRCDYAVAQTEVPALGHDWDDGTPAFGGGTTYTCKRCGATKWQGSGGMVHIHVPVLHEAVQATCTEPGNSAYYSCTGCDKYFSDEECKNQIEEDSWVIPPQHTLEFVAYKAPTCVEDGNEAYYICTAGCDKFFSDENAENEVEEDSWVIPATGEHVFVDGFCTMCGLGDGTNTAFKIASAKLTISNDIVVVYSAAVPENMTDPYMVFTFNGKDYRVESKGVDNKNRPTFAFEGVTPEKMGDNICAKLYATTAYGQTACVTKENYSVREYCVNSMNKYQNVAGSDKLMTLLTDILVYGATAQQYTKYHTDALVTEGVDLSHATEFTTVTETKLARTGEEDAEIKWVSASLQCGSQMAMVFTFTTTVPEVTTVEVTINGRTSVYTIPESRVNSNGTYSTTFTGISATEFDDTVTAVFKKDGVQVGQTLTYSVNSYVYSMQDNDTVPYLADLVKAIYNYGASARAYAGK